MSVTNTTDDRIAKLLSAVKTRQDELKQMEALTKSSWKTNLSYSFGTSKTDAKNLAVMQEDDLVNLIADACLRSAAQNDACADLGIQGRVSTVNGYVYADWLQDAKKRLALININTKKKQLEALEDQLNSLVSPELRREMELAAIEATLNSMQ